MIIDKLENLTSFLPDSCKKAVEKFLNVLSPDIPDGQYDILGEKVFARVLSYDTSPKEECSIEAHNRYIDVQATLEGAEGIDIFPRHALNVKICYNEQDDIEFYDEAGARPYASNTNLPEYFSMIFPEEAHRPQQQVMGFSRSVKKVVIKMEVECWTKKK